MNESELLEELADILNTESGMLTPDTLLSDVRWDSMALLAYQAFLRFHFGRILPGVSCADFTTVGDLMKKATAE